jgi:hypothetical protein
LKLGSAGITLLWAYQALKKKEEKKREKEERDSKEI